MNSSHRVLLSFVKAGQAVIISLAPVLAENPAAAGEKAVGMFDRHMDAQIKVLMSVATSQTANEVKRRLSS